MVCSYSDLTEHLYQWLDPDLRRLVQSRMQYLRQKLEPDPLQTRYLHTIRGIGYRLTMKPIARRLAGGATEVATGRSDRGVLMCLGRREGMLSGNLLPI